MAKERNLLSAMLANKCPRCRKGDLYKQKGLLPLRNLLKMHERCEVCGQKTELEVGFFYGTGYVSYGLSIAIAITIFIIYFIIFGFSWQDNSIWNYSVTTIIILLILQPWLMRLSRTIYLTVFVKYEPNAENEKLTMISQSEEEIIT
ncbi:MAG TPA: DUF983 domain-containing protein [Chitinophagaceae bacterium]|nr:DUF983 domain-containing protein [Chitinophagaceae bacterium]